KCFANDFDFGNSYSFDLTSDETIWACSLGSSAMAMYRVCLDQVVAQRLLASRTLESAQRTVLTGALLLVVLYFVGLFSWSGIDPLISWMRPNTTG
ncbi:hypothetical protein MRX96_053121, partial [Rhipicephalus microplus]